MRGGARHEYCREHREAYGADMNSYIGEAFILGALILVVLSNIDVNVNVYVDGKKATAAEAAMTTERPENEQGE